MEKFKALREAELRALMISKAQSVLIISSQQEPREDDNTSIAELAAEIVAIAVEIDRQHNRVN